MQIMNQIIFFTMKGESFPSLYNLKCNNIFMKSSLTSISDNRCRMRFVEGFGSFRLVSKLN